MSLKTLGRRAAVAACLVAFATGAAAQTIKIRAAGNLLATGLIQTKKEQPFFETLATTTGLPIEVDYKPMDSAGVKDIEGLRVLKSGLFDIVTLRVAQVSRDDPFLLGLDLVGLNTDYATGRKVVDAYRDAFDKRLQEKFNGKLLGFWGFGPQVVFCKPKIESLADLKGKKVRVYDQSLAKFIERVGGIPVTLGFGETQQALQRGVVDCGITGPSSANSAGWPEVTTHFMPLGFQIAVQSYAINLDTWKKFTPEQQAKLVAAFRKFEDETWAYSKELWDDAVRCNVGQDPCTTVKKFNMTLVPVRPADVKLVQESLGTSVVPAWAESCDKVDPTCSATWKKLIGPIVSVQ